MRSFGPTDKLFGFYRQRGWYLDGSSTDPSHPQMGGVYERPRRPVFSGLLSGFRQLLPAVCTPIPIRKSAGSFTA
jgi:hypothetical protein